MKTVINNPESFAREYREKGYAIVRRVFDSRDIALLASAFEELKAYASQFDSTYRDKNQLYVYQWGESTDRNKLLRFVKWPSYRFPVFERFRTDPRLLEIIRPLLGDNIKQITNQAAWKEPGDPRTSYGYHQDAYWRTPREAFRNLESSYLQTFIAVDPHTVENGCLSVIEGSHRKLECYRPKGNVLTSPFSSDDLSEYGLESFKQVNVLLEPGDVVIWGPYMFHGSDANRSTRDRRVYINGYVKAEDCDRGEYAFRNGRPVALGEPQLVDYDDLYTNPEPHYL